MYGETGLEKIESIIYTRMIGFWHRLRTGSSNKISHKLFTFSKRLSDHNLYNQKWVTKIKQILNNIGLSYLWDFKGISASQLKSAVKLRLSDAFIQNWGEELRGNILCTNYRLIKSTFNLEYYLSKLSKDLRITMSRFRTGSHSLPISDKRYDAPDERNVCPLCLLDTGDEYHYVMICIAFDHIRPCYIAPYYFKRPNTLKFSQLFSSRNLSTLTKLSKFVKQIMYVFRH